MTEEERGNLGGAAETAFVIVVIAGEVVVGFLNDGVVLDLLAGVFAIEVFLKFFDGAVGAVENFFAVFAPGFAEFLEEVFEADAALGVFGREVGAAKEGFQVRRQEDRHGPAAAT